MGTTTARRTGIVLATLVGLFASLLLAVAATAPAEAAAGGKVRGNIAAGSTQLARGTVRWFTRDWSYLGARKVRGGAYQLTLAPGTYWLQVVDDAPSYDVRKFAPTNVRVTVRSGSTTVKNVRMQRGGAVTGTVRAGGKVAPGARVVAANRAEQSFETRANGRGQFAIGGLPTGKYSLFTYDRKRTWVDKSTYVGNLKAGTVRNTRVTLRKRAGSLLVDLYAGTRPAPGRVTVTAVSRKTGQWWTATSRRGSVTFTGLHPGRYRLVMPGVGEFLGRTGAVKNGNVRPNRAAFGSFRLTKRGASVSGRVVDGTSGQALGNVAVTLYARGGQALASTTTGSSGGFRLTGQLTTSTGLTLQVRPGGPNPPYLTTGSLYCRFDQRNQSISRITTGRNLALTAVAIPRSAAQDSDACR